MNRRTHRTDAHEATVNLTLQPRIEDSEAARWRAVLGDKRPPAQRSAWRALRRRLNGPLGAIVCGLLIASPFIVEIIKGI